MNERIKQLRKELGMTQKDFAEKIGVKQNTVATYEMGRNPPTDTVITLICNEFGVNETWLRTGEGEMFVKLSRNEQIGVLVGKALSGNPDDKFKYRVQSFLSRLTEDEWTVLEQIADKFAEEYKEERE